MAANTRPAEGGTLTQRQLNRALLARQLLLERASLSAAEALEHLVGLQSQAPNDPYVALWSRLDGFHTDHLSQLMLERTAVRGSLMRGTIHVVTTPDYLQLRSVLEDMHFSFLRQTSRYKELIEPRISVILDTGRELLRQRPLTSRQLGAHLDGQFPDIDGATAAHIIRFMLPLVQTTPRGVWGGSQQATWAHIKEWAGTPIFEIADPSETIRRYLAGFGPATVADIQAWSGMKGLRTDVNAMRSELVTYRNETGQELFDMPDAPMPDPETPAPVRFLPGFDNILLSHKDRTRIISEEHRKVIGTRNGLFAATYLVDGFVAGMWDIKRAGEQATLTIRPFESHPPETVRELEEEGARLLMFIQPNAELRVHTESG